VQDSRGSLFRCSSLTKGREIMYSVEDKRDR
jgi:hypothetical protein